MFLSPLPSKNSIVYNPEKVSQLRFCRAVYVERGLNFSISVLFYLEEQGSFPISVIKLILPTTHGILSWRWLSVVQLASVSSCYYPLCSDFLKFLLLVCSHILFCACLLSYVEHCLESKAKLTQCGLKCCVLIFQQIQLLVTLQNLRYAITLH